MPSQRAVAHMIVPWGHQLGQAPWTVHRFANLFQRFWRTIAGRFVSDIVTMVNECELTS
jgi:hypothetical protein